MTSFVGREAEIGQILARLDDQAVRLLTLTGPGGVGKTRLATEVTQRVAGDYADGARYVSLASLRDPALVPAAVAQATSAHRSGDRPLLDEVAVALARRHLLLVLDNFEHLLDDAPTWLSSLLAACPRLKVLVTSRTALNISGEHRYAVPPLPVPGEVNATPLAENAAVALFVQRARAVRPDLAFDPATLESIGELCQRLEGLPLAIELAAARVSIFTPEQLVHRLHDRFDLLEGARRDAPERQRSMRNAIAWSYGLLTPEEQHLFRQVSIFVGGFTLDGAAAVADPAAAGIVAGVSALADHSLLRIMADSGDTPHYAMLETLREYGLEQLRATGEESAARERHARWYLKLAGRATPYDPTAQLAWLRDLERENGNIHAALTWLRDAGHVRDVAAIATALRWYWYLTGHDAEGLAWMEWALDRRERLDESTVTDLLLFSGQLAIKLGIAYADARIDAVTERVRGSGDALREAEASFYTALSAENRGDYAEAAAGFRAASTLYERAGHAWRIGAIAYHRGVIAYATGDDERATRHFEAAMATATHDLLVPALCRSFLALIACARGEPMRGAELMRNDPLVSNGGIHVDDRIVLGAAAVVAASLGDDEVAARILGAADAAGGAVMLPEQRAFAHAETVARRRLGEPGWQAAFEAGQRLRRDQLASEILRLGEGPSGESTPAPEPARLPEDLTPREFDVLRLMASGKTNQQIADDLFISRKTVAHHVASILYKLDADSRTAAVSVAIRGGLA